MKFCFIGNISGALKGHTPGGAELQITLLAKALALKGQEVVVVDPSSEESFVTREGIKVISIPGWNKGIRGLRLFFHRIPRLKKILLEQDADYYYVRMRAYMHLVPFWASKKTKGKFIVAAAHDLDVCSFYKKYKYQYKPKFNLYRLLTVEIPNDFVFRYLLNKADYVFLQHSGQKQLLKPVKGKVVVFPNIFDFSNITPSENPPADYFIHAGTLTVLKGSQNLYDLINTLDKKMTIVVVGQPADGKSDKIFQQLKKKENVVLKGRLSHNETIQLIANAKAFINTSNFEGFPNVFLEAWATGVPVISLNVNPGNIFEKRSLGICCNGDIKGMKESIELYQKDNSINKQEIVSYVLSSHDFNTSGERFLNILHESQNN